MNSFEDAYITTQLQEVDLVERPSSDERALLLAAEAQHRQRLLNGDRPRLEDLAEEWIELLRASRQKTPDWVAAAIPAVQQAGSATRTEK